MVGKQAFRVLLSQKERDEFLKVMIIVKACNESSLTRQELHVSETASQQVGCVCFCSCQVKIITNSSDFPLAHLYAYTPASPNTDVPQLQIC